MIEELRHIAEVEFADIVKASWFVDNKLRISIADQTFVDVYLSRDVVGKFGFHWERRDRGLYRYDNVPDINWKSASTFPYHFHRGSHDNVESSPFPCEPIAGFRGFMCFVRDVLGNKNG